MPTTPGAPNDLRRPTDQLVLDTLLAWFTTPRLQDELRTRDRDAIKHVVDLLRRRVRLEHQSRPARTRTAPKDR